MEANEPGAQRLSLPALRQWEAQGLGLFIHFGMATFDGDEFSKGDQPSSVYAPDRLDVDQWVNVARDAGFRYAVLTTKHVSGHCLWPTKHNDYHVGTSGNPTDVVERYVKACARTGVKPGFYYCSWDNHNRFGSVTPQFAADGSQGNWNWMYATRAYEDFQWAQCEELVARYGAPFEWWIDIPNALSHAFRRQLYDRLAALGPESVIMMNTGIGDGVDQPKVGNWPTDLIAIETRMPPTSASSDAHHGHQPWREVLGKKYYLPGEVCDTVCKRWFYQEGDRPKSDGELLALALLAKARGCNLLLDVGPDRHGLIPKEVVDALGRWQKNLAALG
ncbi:MAG: alpha-L-fucosidase [Spirochaetes bacterium]|nr:alpha-L-fucosidase [Spirochaetota bacterium]